MRRVLTGIDQLQAQITALDRQLVTHMAVEETQAAWRSAELAGMRDRLGRVESQIEAIHRRLDEVIT
jgi:ubiquinone biosynthesis protein UbiJ